MRRRTVRRPAGPGSATGRPPTVPPGERRYRLLAEMLTSLIVGTMPEPGSAAEEAGREWGAYLTEQPPPYQRLTDEEALAKLTAIMEELGFAPQVEADGGGKYRLCLRQCPFREVAEHHQDVICSLHLGLMRGALARTLAPVTADRLDPFVKPSLCVARLTARDDPGERHRPRPGPGSLPVPCGYVVSRSSPARTAAWLRFRSFVAVSSVTGRSAARTRSRATASRAPGWASSAVYRRRNSSNLAGSWRYQVRSSADGAASFAHSSSRAAACGGTMERSLAVTGRGGAAGG